MNKAVQEGRARCAAWGSRCAVPTRISRPTSEYKGAQTVKGDRQGNQANAGALKENLVSIGNHAANLLEQARRGQIDPWKAVGAGQLLGAEAGLDPQMFGFNANVPGNAPTRALAMLQSVAGNALSAADRIKLPSEVALNTAKGGRGGRRRRACGVRKTSSTRRRFATRRRRPTRRRAKRRRTGST